MLFRALAFATFLSGYGMAMYSAAYGAESYQLVTYKDGQRYVDDFNLTHEDCAAEMAQAFGPEVDGVACERQ